MSVCINPVNPDHQVAFLGIVLGISDCQRVNTSSMSSCSHPLRRMQRPDYVQPINMPSPPLTMVTVSPVAALLDTADAYHHSYI